MKKLAILSLFIFVSQLVWAQKAIYQQAPLAINNSEIKSEIFSIDDFEMPFIGRNENE